ncbi:MAG: hypothetical protein AB7H81_08990 [Vicinamibacterales bacterium]
MTGYTASGDFPRFVRIHLTASDEVTQVQSVANRFRIKIWDSASGGIVYDNKHGEPDDLSSDTRAITSGAISVHR